MDSTDPELLDPQVDPHADTEPGDHPAHVTLDEELEGNALYDGVDDLDDDDNGLHSPRATVASGEAVRRARIVKECLLRHGVPEVSIELQIGRPASGDDWHALTPFSVISHHIASTPTPGRPTPGLSLVKRGRSDLPGPLCNGTAGVDLVYRILTLGLANHPGKGGPWTVRGPLGAYTVPRDVARAYAWGTEYEGGYTDEVWNRTYTNKRTGKSMTFREFMGRCNAGLVEAIWLINGRGKHPTPTMDLSGYHGEHKTWTSRKVDRRGYSADSGRAEIRKWNHIVNPKPDTRPAVDLSWMIYISGRYVEDSSNLNGGGMRHVVRALEKAGLMAEGNTFETWGGKDRDAYSAWQRSLGYTGADADGVVGRASLTALGDRFGFRVIE